MAPATKIKKVFKLPCALFLQARNQPVGITMYTKIMLYKSVTISQTERALYRLQTHAIIKVWIAMHYVQMRSKVS